MANEYGVDTERKLTALGLVGEAVVAVAQRLCNSKQPCGAEVRLPGAKPGRCGNCPLDDVDALFEHMQREIG